MPLIATYPYLIGSFGLLAFFAVAFVLRPEHRRLALISASVSAPYSLLAVVFVPTYWDPVQLFRFGMGPEDLVFSFANGGLVWILAAAYYSASPRVRIGGFVVRCAGATTAFLLVWLAFGRVTGLPIMWAALLAGVVLWVFLVTRDVAALATSLNAAAIFAIGYTLWAAAIIHANPEFAGSWTAEALIGLEFLGVPIEETLWAVTFGAVWPLLVAYSLDLEPRRVSECGASQLEERGFGKTTSPA
jgi:hypothetical protein